MAYVNGNLAMQPKRKPDQKPSYRETKKVVVKRKSIPVQEKLLYLFTILVCVVVAGVVIFRYAQIYQMEQQISTLTQKQSDLEIQIDDLVKQREIANDPKTLMQKAKDLGYAKVDEKEDTSIKVTVQGSAGDTTLANND
ncbi:septum formation initiator family protein [Paenibacillus sacheonensis]|uniref:Cell division initiation protein n=1 Tax=Paenibacillus sacheonensis TaxID=742054 RepID=A0A7X5C0Z6_9BACL|nr:septum formation initiator family protein [Paenibacillus sacheonensis]MBM7565700.1 cell division protein FtsL [Paenibacillus sacheonensis]NBC72242.1 cell division initiation protein [Paenibacillus sacheonensis]